MTPERRNAYPVTAETIADLATKLEKAERERDEARAELEKLRTTCREYEIPIQLLARIRKRLDDA